LAIGQSMNGSPADRVPREMKQRDNQHMRLLLGLLRGAGVDVRENPPGPIFTGRGRAARQVHPVCHRALGVHPANHYDHRKLLVVDGRKALIGGMNVGRQYLYTTAPDPT
jgi:phosphatidylserine/phosphatidylglycerophosphate/cardiolipin synthase-like enzyme